MFCSHLTNGSNVHVESADAYGISQAQTGDGTGIMILPKQRENVHFIKELASWSNTDQMRLGRLLAHQKKSVKAKNCEISAIRYGIKQEIPDCSLPKPPRDGRYKSSLEGHANG